MSTISCDCCPNYGPVYWARAKVHVSQFSNIALVADGTIIILNYVYFSGVFASAKEIYQESGVSGFFQGVVPRLVGEILALVLASSVSFTVSTYVLGDPRYKPTIKTIAGVINACH